MEAFEDFDELPVVDRTWADFLASQRKIVVITNAADTIRKSPQHIDALLASLYAWKQLHREERLTVVLDEIEDLDLGKDGPVGTILRKGGKHRLSLLMASQQFSAEQDKLGKIIGNCGMLAFFRPKDADLSSIAKHIGVDLQQLAALKQGECVCRGGFYNRRRGKNAVLKLKGKTYPAVKYLNLKPMKGTETQHAELDAQT